MDGIEATKPIRPFAGEIGVKCEALKSCFTGADKSQFCPKITQVEVFRDFASGRINRVQRTSLIIHEQSTRRVGSQYAETRRLSGPGIRNRGEVLDV